VAGLRKGKKDGDHGERKRRKSERGKVKIFQTRGKTETEKPRRTGRVGPGRFFLVLPHLFLANGKRVTDSGGRGSLWFGRGKKIGQFQPPSVREDPPSPRPLMEKRPRIITDSGAAEETAVL